MIDWNLVSIVVMGLVFVMTVPMILKNVNKDNE